MRCPELAERDGRWTLWLGQAGQSGRTDLPGFGEIEREEIVVWVKLALRANAMICNSLHTPCVLSLLAIGGSAESVHVQCSVDDGALSAPPSTRISRAILSSHEHRAFRVGLNGVCWNSTTPYSNVFEGVELDNW